MRKRITIVCLSFLIAILGVSVVAHTPFVAKRATNLSSSGNLPVDSELVNLSKEISKNFPRHRTPQALKEATSSGIASLPRANKELTNSFNPMKISPSGATLYGFLGYPSLSENVWSMDEIMSDGSSPSSLYTMNLYLSAGALRGGNLIAFSQQFIWGMVSEFGFGEWNLQTGEQISYQALNLQDYSNAVLTMAYNPSTDMIYAYTYAENGESLQFCGININNPEEKRAIKTNLSIDDVAISFTYSSKDGKFYGINMEGTFVEIDVATGEMTKIFDTDTKLAGYITGLCYSLRDDAFIWNANLADNSSYLYAINLEEKSCTKLADYNFLQYNFIVSPDEVSDVNAPAKPEIEKISFEKGELNGYITYRMPNLTFSGNVISNDMNYSASVDGTVVDEGKASPGESVTISYSGLTQGNHAFSFVATDETGLESPVALSTVYVGFDNPKAPTNVNFNNDGISWDAVADETGANGGYVNISDISYEVYVDGVMVATTNETFVEYSIQQENISSHYAEVIAISNGMKSQPGISNKFIAGKAFSLPLLIEPTEDEIELCSIIDNNNDGFTWTPKYIDSYFVFSYSYSANNDADDWIILPPVEFDSNEKAFKVSIESAVAVSGYPEAFEIYYGSSPEPQNMTKIFKKEGIENTSWITDNATFAVPESGVYYVAVRCCSPADKFDLRIRNIKVEKTKISADSPNTISDIETIPNKNGELKATISFTMPTHSLNGKELNANSQLEAVMKSLSDRKTVKGKPGSRQSIEIGTSQGNNQIGVYVSDANGNNSPTTYINVYTGIDRPGAPENFKGKVSEDNMTIHLSWEAPSVGAGGGYVDPNDLKYNIVLFDEEYGWYVDSSVASFSKTHFDYTLPADCGLVDLGIGVIASNKAGSGTDFAYGSFIVGKPYELPLVDDFTSGDFKYNPLTIWSDDFGSTNWSAYNPATLGEKYANRSGIALIGEAYVDNCSSSLSLPKFSTEFATNPYISLYLYCGSAAIDVYAEAYDLQKTKIGSTTDVKHEGWTDLKIELPDKFKGKKWVTIYIDALFTTTDQYVLFGGYNFKDYLANDMALAAMNAPSEVKIGEAFSVNVVVENYGYEKMSYPALKLEIFKDKQLITSAFNEADPNTLVDSDEKIAFDFEFTATADFFGELEIVASLVDADMNNSNNTATKTIVVSKGNAIVVTDLSARIDSNENVELNWTEPEIKSGHESWEDYPVWSYGSTLGEFKCVDGDGLHQYIIDGLPIPDALLPKAFQVYDISYFGEAYSDIFPASDGRQYIAAFCPCEPEGNIAPANDWLISPELKPESQFSFDLNIFTAGYGNEIVEVLTSSNSDNIEDFTLLKTIKHNNTQWKTYTVTLPKDAKYVALHYVSQDVFGIMIDNINYVNVYGEAKISGYDIYRNGEMIAENTYAPGKFTDETISDANDDYTYHVVPVFNGNRGLLSNSAVINPSGIANLFNKNMVYGSKGEIVINGFANQKVSIFSVDGRLITSVLNNSNNIRVAIQPGIYVVNANKQSVKVFVR